MAGPLATMLLADNGADVVKVESPDGDPARDLPAFQTWNRGKRSVTLDLKSDGGRERALKLVRTADVIVTSYRPGVAERLGIGYDKVHEVNPRAVYAAISGYGAEGERSHLKGYEALVCAKFGRMMMFERIADRAGPGYPAVPCASYSAAMLTAQGVLAALHRRRQTGAGQKVDVSLLAALIPYDLIMWIGRQMREPEPEAEEQTATMYLHSLMGKRQMLGSDDTDVKDAQSKAYDPKQVHRPDFRVPRPNYLTAVTKDGVWLQFANTIDHLCFAQMQALDLLDVYGDERFAKLPAVADEADSETLWEIVLERVRSKTYDEWMAVFDEHQDVAVERIRWPLESLDHRQVEHNGHAVDVPGTGGRETQQIGPLVRFSESQSQTGRRAPNLGEHTEEVLAEAAVAVAPQPPPSAANTNGEGPLAGVTVVDFSAWIAAPYSTGVLANLGARVIRVEVTGGDFSRYSTDGLLSFPMTQGKESIALDLKQPQGREIAQKLIRQADMIVHNFRPGVPERLGIDYETCHTLNPQAIYLNAASYGDSGPDRRKPAFYAIAAANGGSQMRQTGAGHPRPDSQNLPLDELKDEAWRLLKAAEWNADPIAALGSATALLLALYARDGDGSGEGAADSGGQELMTTMLCSNMYANSDETITYDGRPEPPRVDADVTGVGPLYRLYQAAEGWVFLACLRRAEWSAFCDAVERPELASRWDEAWVGGEGATALAASIQEILRGHSAADWERLLAEQDVPIAAVELRAPGQFCLEDETMRELGHMVQVESETYGTYWRHGALQKFSEDGQTFGPWEPLGGRTRAILTELGYGVEEIATLAGDGVVEVWKGTEVTA